MPADLKYLTIEDFRPGIQQRSAGIGDSMKSPPGAADPLATFRCRAFPWGGLGPLPKVVQIKTRALVNGGDVRDDAARIVGLHVTGPMQTNTYESTFLGDDKVELHIAYEYFDGTGAPPDHHFQWERYRVWHDDDDSNIYSTVITHPSPNDFDFIYHPASFCDARLHATDETALGDLFVACGWHPDDMDSPSNVWRLYPDPAVPNAEGTAVILDVNESTLIVQHQGRIISIDNHVFNHGGIGNWVVNDQLVWTQVNLPTVLMDGLVVLGVGVFTQGPVSGYGAVVSASAQELLLVKHRGGATTISGDIDDPTVFSLPGVTSTRGAVTIGVYTSQGFAYGVRNGGVHIWGGGDNSQKLSPNLEDDFWMMRPDDWVEFDGKFDIISDLLLVPNNWVYDFLTQSWWRIEDPAEYQIFQWASSPQSSMFYGTPATFIDDGPIYYRFDYDTLVSDYVWQSQYLAATIDRVVDVREIRIRAISPNENSEIKVTVTAESGDFVEETFQVTSTTIPKLLRANTSLKGTGLKVKVEASSGDGGEAPVLYEIHLGIQESQREAVS